MNVSLGLLRPPTTAESGHYKAAKGGGEDMHWEKI